MRCSACENGDCDGLYENRNRCVGRKEGVSCACKCRITAAADVLTKGASFVGGAACIGGGILAAGLAPPIQGFLIGTGTSLVSKPIRKEMSGEHLEFDDSVSEALTFGAIGASIGSGISLVNGAVTAVEMSSAVVVLTGAAVAGAGVLRNNKT